MEEKNMQQYINRVAVLGSGVMGSAIAAHIAGAGISVSLLDMAPTQIAQSGKDRVMNPRARSIYEKGLGNLITVGNFTDNMEMLADADWIIEVIVERLDIKRDLFDKVNKVRKPGSIVSSNTSGISINTMIETMPLEFRQHFIGTHFFNPPRYMKLVELIPSSDCKPEIRDFMRSFMEKTLGKAVVICKDTPAFIANRIGTFASVAGLQMIENSSFNLAEIDQITGPVMGRPKTGSFRLMDIVGLDIPLFVAQNIIDNIDDPAEKAAFALPDCHKMLVDKKYLGDKTKQGYYKRVKSVTGAINYMWDPAKEEYVVPSLGKLAAVERAAGCRTLNEKLNTLLYAPEEDGRVAWEITKATLLYAARKAEEISYHYADIDTAMKCGYNWEYGPFQIWDAIGLEKSVARMKDEGESIPAWVEEKLVSGDVIFIKDDEKASYIDINRLTLKVVKESADAVLYNMGDDVLCLKFKTKANSVEAGVSEMLLEAVQIVEQGYAGLVLANGGKNFSVGANLSAPTGFIKDMDFGETEKRIETLQQANMAMKYCKRPIVSAPFGMTVGGGAEIVMHTSAAVAAAETYMGLVEIGVGLVPAGGGIKELLFRYMQYAAKSPKSNPINFVQAAWEFAAMGKVSGSAHEAVKWGLLRPFDRISLGQEYIVEEAKRMVLYLSEGYRPPVKQEIRVTGSTGLAAIQYTSSNMYKGDFITEYDAHIADKIAYVITGGDAAPGSLVTEEHILSLEKDAFMSLIVQEKTQQRIEHMLKTGKRLSN